MRPLLISAFLIAIALVGVALTLVHNSSGGGVGAIIDATPETATVQDKLRRLSDGEIERVVKDKRVSSIAETAAKRSRVYELFCGAGSWASAGGLSPHFGTYTVRDGQLCIKDEDAPIRPETRRYLYSDGHGGYLVQAANGPTETPLSIYLYDDRSRCDRVEQ